MPAANRHPKPVRESRGFRLGGSIEQGEKEKETRMKNKRLYRRLKVLLDPTQSWEQRGEDWDPVSKRLLVTPETLGNETCAASGH